MFSAAVVRLILILAAIILVLVIIATGYVKAPPDKAVIISGLHKNPRILIGRAGIRIPFLERTNWLYLGQITVDIKTEESVPTKDFISVDVDAVAKVCIGQSGEQLAKAARNFLDKKPADIAKDLQDSLQGNMREIIGTLSLEEINTDRDHFSDQVVSKAAVDMAKLGIEILSCNIQSVEDGNGLIAALGAKHVAEIQKEAAIVKAEADRDVSVAQAKAKQAANEQRVLSERNIAEKNNELAIAQFNLKKQADTEKADADAAYELQNQTQQKNIQAAMVEAQIAKAEREEKLKETEVKVTEQSLQAEVNRKADAEKYRTEKQAEADLTRRQKAAEAEAYEAAKKADAEKSAADAAKYVALQEAEGIKAKYEAEAEGIRAKGRAEAEAKEAIGKADAAAMKQKAEAYQMYNKAAMAEMLIKILPDMAGEVAKPLSQIDKITIIGGDGGENGVSQIAGNVPAVMAKTIESVKEATGLDLRDMMRAESYDAKVNRDIHVTGLAAPEKADTPKDTDEKPEMEDVPDEKDSSTPETDA